MNLDFYTANNNYDDNDDYDKKKKSGGKSFLGLGGRRKESQQ